MTETQDRETVRLHPRRAGFTYDLRSWKHGDPVAEVNGLSYDGARHVAEAHAALGEQVRIYARELDYVESWTLDPEPGFRAGRFAETTMVHPA